MNTNKNLNLDAWRKDIYERMRTGQPKIVIQSEIGEKMRERLNRRRQNPAENSQQHQNFSFDRFSF